MSAAARAERPAPWVVAVRAAMPSPRPQGWQALQMAVGLRELGAPTVGLVADAGRPDGGPQTLELWMGRALPDGLRLRIPARPSRPPLAGFRFRRALDGLREPETLLLCRDARVAAREAGRGWKRVVLEWHVAPEPGDARHRAALAGADLHVAPARGLLDDLDRAGVPGERRLLLPNACGLDAARASARAQTRGEGVLAMGLHRRGGLDAVLDAWAEAPDLPPLLLAGRDQGGLRWGGWRARIAEDPRLLGRVRLVGPVWGAAREALLDSVAAWITPYPDDGFTRTRLSPLQLADALGSGLPVVAPALPSVLALAGEAPLQAYGGAAGRGIADAVRSALASPRDPEACRRARWVDRARILAQAALRLPRAVP